MAEETLPRFQLLDDDQLQDLINSADGKDTKRVREILHKNIRRLGLDLRYLQVINTGLDSVNKLPNSELNNVDLGLGLYRQKFYAGAIDGRTVLYT